jgi:hypothetical protein
MRCPAGQHILRQIYRRWDDVLPVSSLDTITIIWEPPSAQARLAWANTTDTTEAGAYACGLAAIAHSRGLYTVERAEMLTGADYYMAPLDDYGDGSELS